MTTTYHHGDLRRSLVTAAVDLLTETQDWGFSLREVARRAGVSHAAPYNHFSSKQDLLAAVAANGYELLRIRMLEAKADVETPAEELLTIGVAYVRFGVDNPAHYRLMFGRTLADCKDGPTPAISALADAGLTAKGVLYSVVQHGITTGAFTVAAANIDLAVLAAWSLVHGLTMLVIDGLAGPDLSPERIAEQVTGLLLSGMKR